MELKIDLRPVKYEARTKSELISKMNLGSYCVSNYGNYRTNIRSTETVIVYNIVKYNKKTSQKRIADKSGKYKNITKSTIIRKKKWVGYVYTFNTTILKMMGKKVNQKSRNFEFINLK